MCRTDSPLLHVLHAIVLLQGKAKDSGWGSNDEAVSLSAAVAENESEAKPSGPKVAKKQVASAFDILDEDPEEQDDPASDLDESEPVNGKTGKLLEDGSHDDDSSSNEGEQVNTNFYIKPYLQSIRLAQG